MIGTLISVGTGILGSVISSREASKQAERTQQQLDKQRNENAAWYNRRYYEDGTQRADVQRAMTKGADNLKRQTKAAAGTNAVMGGTNASVAAANQAATQAYGDMVSQAAATADARKDAVEDAYRSRSAQIENQQTQADEARSNARINAIGSAVNAVGTAAAGLEQATGNRLAAKNPKKSIWDYGMRTNKLE